MASDNAVVAEQAESATDSASGFGLVWDGLADAMVQLGQLLPRIIAALLIVAIGYALSRVVGRIVTRTIRRLGLQQATERAGIEQSLRKAGIRHSVPDLFGAVIYFSLLAVFLAVALHVVGLTGVTDAVDSLVAFIPRLFVASVLLVVGLLIATLLRGLIAASAASAGLSYAEPLGAGVYYLLMVLTAITAFEQLEIRFALLNQLIVIAFAAAALGCAISAGLGGREVVAGLIAGYWLRQQIQAGDLVNIAGLEGRIRVVGAVATIVETDDDGLLHRHSIPNVRMIREAVYQ